MKIYKIMAYSGNFSIYEINVDKKTKKNYITSSISGHTKQYLLKNENIITKASIQDGFTAFTSNKDELEELYIQVFNKYKNKLNEKINELNNEKKKINTNLFHKIEIKKIK